MKEHFQKAWSWYLVAASVLAPFFPFINAAITQGIGSHAHLKSVVMSISLWLAHRATPPSAV